MGQGHIPFRWASGQQERVADQGSIQVPPHNILRNLGRAAAAAGVVYLFAHHPLAQG